MKIYFLLLTTLPGSYFGVTAQHAFVGSTPAHAIVRNFLQISLTDSIDFIRWKLLIAADQYELQCQYGLAKASTPGFENKKTVAAAGKLQKTGNTYYLRHNGKMMSIFEVNAGLLHFLDHNNQLLIGNGGYSYALNSTAPTNTDQFNIPPKQSTITSPLVFEGRTPCQELSAILALNKSDACNKMKWYFIFYTDTLTGKPSYYLKGGIGYRKETMERGKWQIIMGKNGRIIYQVNPDNKAYTLHLLKGDDNILFFVDNKGRLLVGNENFSYTLNRRKQEYAPARSPKKLSPGIATN